MRSWELTPFEETSLSVKVNLRLEQELELHFYVSDPESILSWPSKSSHPKRKQGLWEETCLELFCLNTSNHHYEEWNFSPSLDWNCFEFVSYRKPEILKETNTPAPTIEDGTSEVGPYLLKVKLPQPFGDQINLCAVLKEKNGNLHYFALKHDFEGKPDFHNSSLFLSL
jgi:hypothetical protein